MGAVPVWSAYLTFDIFFCSSSCGVNVGRECMVHEVGQIDKPILYALISHSVQEQFIKKIENGCRHLDFSTTEISSG